jgi:chromate transporter
MRAGPIPPPPDGADETAPPPTLLELFLGFNNVAALAFGGVLPWARYVVVERRRWLRPDEFTDTLALCQLLPGPNIVNLAIAVGRRFHGPAGSVAGFLGLVTLPIVIVLCVASVYAEVATAPAVQGGLRGMAAAAAGLIVATGIRMAEPILRRHFWASAPFMALIFVAAGFLRLPLWPVVIVLAPFAILADWRSR